MCYVASIVFDSCFAYQMILFAAFECTKLCAIHNSKGIYHHKGRKQIKNGAALIGCTVSLFFLLFTL